MVFDVAHTPRSAGFGITIGWGSLGLAITIEIAQWLFSIGPQPFECRPHIYCTACHHCERCGSSKFA